MPNFVQYAKENQSSFWSVFHKGCQNMFYSLTFDGYKTPSASGLIFSRFFDEIL